MQDFVRRVKYYTTIVPNQPGAAAKILDVLRESGISLDVFSGFPVSEEQSQLDFVPTGGEAIVAAAQKAGVKLEGPKTALLISDWEHTGAVAEVLDKLEQAVVNITAMQAISTGDWRYGAILWIKQSDLDKAAQALGLS